MYTPSDVSMKALSFWPLVQALLFRKSETVKVEQTTPIEEIIKAD
jgi:hypothetical protein